MVSQLAPDRLCEEGDRLLREQRCLEALDVFKRALLLDGGYPEALSGYNRAIRQVVPRWHFAMVNDQERVAAFDRALAQAVGPDSIVLDIGSGSGLLALVAAAHGARLVVSCEGLAPVAEIAELIVRRNGLAGRVRICNKWSTELQVGVDIPEPADVLVTEIVDCGLLGEGVLPTLEHASQHLLRPGAKFVPQRGRVLAQLVESEELHLLNHVELAAGFDLSLFNRLSSLEYFSTRLAQYKYRPLTRPFDVFGFDFSAGCFAPERKLLRCVAAASGRCHAVVFWFSLQLAPGLALVNDPANVRSHWKQAVQSFAAPVWVGAGTELQVIVRHDRQRVFFEGVVPQPAGEAGS